MAKLKITQSSLIETVHKPKEHLLQVIDEVLVIYGYCLCRGAILVLRETCTPRRSTASRPDHSALSRLPRRNGGGLPGGGGGLHRS